MANIKLNNNEYPIPDSALAAPTADFVAHLGTIAGSDMKVIVGGVEYGIDSSKVSGSIANFEEFLDVLVNGPKLAPGLYETGAIAKLNEGKDDEAAAMLKTSWADLIANGDIVVEDGVVSAGYALPDNLLEKNEYGFYFDVPYSFDGNGVVFHEDGSVDLYAAGELVETLPSGSVVYNDNTDNTIDMSSLGLGIFAVGSNGEVLCNEEIGIRFYIDGSDGPIQLEGDLIMPNDGEITALCREAFSCQESLTGIILSNSLSSIATAAFADCSSLVSITLPSGVTDICDFAFYGCLIDSIIIPDGVTHIGTRAFANCSNLESITIPKSIICIDTEAFDGCSSLSSFVFDGTMSQWKAAEDGFQPNWHSFVGGVQCSDGYISFK